MFSRIVTGTDGRLRTRALKNYTAVWNAYPALCVMWITLVLLHKTIFLTDGGFLKGTAELPNKASLIPFVLHKGSC